MNLLTQTGDGSNTLFNEKIGENYHSKHGALQESKHVFIQSGLVPVLENNSSIKLLEVGFGTGLNFLLTLEECSGKKVSLSYTALEPFPLELEQLDRLDYKQYINVETWNTFIENYNASLLSTQNFGEEHSLTVTNTTLEEYESDLKFDLIYFDAFSVRHQPELWTDEIIDKTCNLLKPGGIFVTYAITGKLKRAVKAAGCTIEKLPGAPGKREMLRATKTL